MTGKCLWGIAFNLFLPLMKYFILIVLLLGFSAQWTSGQKTQCINQFDSSSVLTFLDKRDILLLPEGYTLETVSQFPSMKPQVSFNAKKCQWKVVSFTFFTSYKGRCRLTNGCTIKKTRVIVLSGSSKRILSYKSHTQVFSNYE